MERCTDSECDFDKRRDYCYAELTPGITTGRKLPGLLELLINDSNSAYRNENLTSEESGSVLAISAMDLLYVDKDRRDWPLSESFVTICREAKQDSIVTRYGINVFEALHTSSNSEIVNQVSYMIYAFASGAVQGYVFETNPEDSLKDRRIFTDYDNRQLLGMFELIEQSRASEEPTN